MPTYRGYIVTTEMVVAGAHSASSEVESQEDEECLEPPGSDEDTEGSDSAYLQSDVRAALDDKASQLSALSKKHALKSEEGKERHKMWEKFKRTWHDKYESTNATKEKAPANLIQSLRESVAVQKSWFAHYRAGGNSWGGATFEEEQTRIDSKKLEEKRCG